ncbi:hypothetical protein FM105_06205 [Brevibacterium yomogidense]|uniref:Uncharacterized protein n=1 Tax=Brevibacterium yomogidense TaxID=946573 RepID=A0A1X6XC54_9MICO|nr:hypothetical protein FM105_06205 [Brevibacterium yomogidense]
MSHEGTCAPPPVFPATVRGGWHTPGGQSRRRGTRCTWRSQQGVRAL